MVEKSALREFVKDYPLTDYDRKKSDDLLLARFLSLSKTAQSSTILLYYGIGKEPDTARLLEPLTALGIHVALPRCTSPGQMEARQYLGAERLIPNFYGIPEPDESCPIVKKKDLSLILVPALCCDERGYRLGHGGGYYDRYLADFQGLTMALCRKKLLLPLIPTEPHDQPVDIIVTENRCLSFS